METPEEKAAFYNALNNNEMPPIEKTVETPEEKAARRHNVRAAIEASAFYNALIYNEMSPDVALDLTRTYVAVQTTVQMTIRKTVQAELMDVIDRLYTSETKASRGTHSTGK